METTSFINLQAVIRGFLIRKTFGIQSMIKRKNILKEVVDTEESLLEKMQMMLTIYAPPLKQINMAGYSQKVDYVFQYLEPCIGAAEHIVKRGKEMLTQFSYSTNTAEFFSFVAFYLWAYGEYSINYHITETMFNSVKKNMVYSRLLTILDSKNKEKQVLSDLLVEPLQRTTRYPLLLKTMITATPKKHSDYEGLLLVEKDYSFFTALVNQKAKMRDDLMKLYTEIDVAEILIPKRYYVGGEMMVYNKKKCYGFLFNDKMMWFSISKSTKIGKPSQFLFDGEFVFDEKSGVLCAKNNLSLIKFGLMPIQIAFPLKKIAEKWEATVNSLIKTRLWDVSNENAWMSTVDCQETFQSEIEAAFPKTMKWKR
ncbi:DH domain-containing protein [Entamoeba marina]